MLNQALVLFGNRDEDGSEVPFIWARVLTDAPKDEAGQPVKNPGSILIYGAKGFKTGDCENVVLMSRGIGGLYDLIPAAKAEEVMTKMKKTMADLKEVPLAESRSSSSTDRATASARSSEKRQARKAARSTVIDVTADIQPE